MVEFRLLGAETGLNIPEALPASQLGEGHAAILIPTGELVHFIVSSIPGDTTPEGLAWKRGHQLGKHQCAGIHGSGLLGLVEELVPPMYENAAQVDPGNFVELTS